MMGCASSHIKLQPWRKRHGLHTHYRLALQQFTAMRPNAGDFRCSSATPQ